MNARLIVPFMLAFIVVDIMALSFYFTRASSSARATVESRRAALPTRTLEIAGASIQVEVVSSTEDVRRGLSDRPSMERNQGMLFDLGYRDIHPFWMNRMRFPLDMIWVDGDAVVEIAENVLPPGFGRIPVTRVPKAEADRVLEVNAGLVDEIGLKVGDRMTGY